MGLPCCHHCLGRRRWACVTSWILSRPLLPRDPQGSATRSVRLLFLKTSSVWNEVKENLTGWLSFSLDALSSLQPRCSSLSFTSCFDPPYTIQGLREPCSQYGSAASQIRKDVHVYIGWSYAIPAFLYKIKGFLRLGVNQIFLLMLKGVSSHKTNSSSITSISSKVIWN